MLSKNGDNKIAQRSPAWFYVSIIIKRKTPYKPQIHVHHELVLTILLDRLDRLQEEWEIQGSIPCLVSVVPLFGISGSLVWYQWFPCLISVVPLFGISGSPVWYQWFPCLISVVPLFGINGSLVWYQWFPC